MSNARKAIFRVKDSSGQYVTTHVQTSADQVLFGDGQNLEEKVLNLENCQPPLATEEMDGLMASTDKVKLNQLTTDSIQKLDELDLSQFDLIQTKLAQCAEKLNSLEDVDTELKSADAKLRLDLAQVQTEIESATDRIDSFIEANNVVVEEIAGLKAADMNHSSQIGDLADLTTNAKHSLVLAINELVSKTANLLQIDDNTSSTAKTWSSSKIDSELSVKSDKNHQHGLNSVNDWRTHLYDKAEVDDLLNALALGFTWKAPVDSLDDLPQNPELGWAVIVAGRSLYVFGEEGWMDLGVSSLPPIATQDFDGLMSRHDKAKLDLMDAETLNQSVASVTDLLSRVGVNEQAILEINQMLITHRELLDRIDFEKLNQLDLGKIEKLGTDLTNVASTVNEMAKKVSANETGLATQKQRLDSFESRPQIYYQAEEPRDAVNGSFWIQAGE